MSLTNDDISEDDISEDDYSEDETLTTARTEQFSILFCELERCREDEQKQKIEELNGLIDEMNKEEFKSVFTIELFNKIHQMIEKNTLSLESAILLLKHVGRCKELKSFFCFSFDDSLLSKRMKEMMIDEYEKKKDEKNEKHLTDLCECYALLGEDDIHDELLSVIMPCLLKAASKKEESDEAQKEKENALLALSLVNEFEDKDFEQCLIEIKEIIKRHQEHRNLTWLAYQSTWQFLMERLYDDAELEGVLVNELHFVREAAREIEELSKCVDWKKRKEGEEKEEKKTKEEIILVRWIRTLETFSRLCKLRNEELAGIIGIIVRLFRAAKFFSEDLIYEIVECLSSATGNSAIEIDDLLKEGAIDAMLGEAVESNLRIPQIFYWKLPFIELCERLKGKMENEEDEAKRKVMKRKVLERMEEEGYEDSVFKFCNCMHRGMNKYYSLIDDPDDYFLYC
ncbi:uncharacterized protein MONOS_1743 [Monocercomonoides exilis]|uniref:uncharacterized protein n=1 Tax=Monocercomonoides exilis TaxID=2049356 RepID=UPI0035593F97|nr:hypothetical protein MONOS_1743 [Monocercomonoides exilis]|eukprot:MONOS_1743.1-p1 / transcript=MONOS_1743.1 / gene=MONOS_1743 / organism=Monocercomonoides_exilis_PA203 / gene_product=unspecified product / transcript_product=unspecified product / location=Mono_scaffold00032:111135-112632(-) / protein_length=456 / sequence_SO=supercontig / SO=protein_coding / is_pseudo=false